MHNDFGLERIAQYHNFIVLEASAVRLNDAPGVCYSTGERHRYKTLLLGTMARHGGKVAVSKDTINVLQAGLVGVESPVLRSLETDLLGLLSRCAMSFGSHPEYRRLAEQHLHIKEQFGLRGGEYSTVAQTMFLAILGKGLVAFLSNDARMPKALEYWNDSVRRNNLAIYTLSSAGEFCRTNTPPQRSLQDTTILSAPQQKI